MFRCVKNGHNVIIAMAMDQNQSGNYPADAADDLRQGVWCTWAMNDVPGFNEVEGADIHAMRFKENDEGTDIAIRSDADVLADPTGEHPAE